MHLPDLEQYEPSPADGAPVAVSDEDTDALALDASDPTNYEATEGGEA